MDHVCVGQTLTDLETPPEAHNHVEATAERFVAAELARTRTDGRGEQESEEAERQRIERLGRERPAKLTSFGAEILFCYSVIASQFMAVSCAGRLIEVHAKY